MTAQELDEAKADLALAKAALRRRLGPKDVAAVASTGENVALAKASVTELRDIIADLETRVRLSGPCGFGAIYIG
ncbi:hypothetical protein SAMN02799622_04208 [Methylobacterium sp. UNC378MF]|uniref:Uncharacterized protein n=1 Tax=Methylobacterium oryzae TaxID=334852 RepID=A0ABU7TM54_9HYPH|nr:gpW family head-tail joining protein [Methylobacterium sp. UNC378MF]SDA28012.1 hypothetical protein SAMN02799622_04208 [Methylobacterium sp. UNC378MF]